MTLPVLMLLASIGLRGQTTCPTVQEVSARLDGLDQDSDGPMRWVELNAQPDHLQLSLWSPEGSLEAVRELPLPASCDALAKASAVTIATWALRPAPPPPVVKPPPERRIFDADMLATERMRLEHVAVAPAPGRVRLRAPLGVMGLGALTAASGPLLAALGSSATAPSIVLFCAGLSTVMGGLLWLIGALGTAPHDFQIVF